MREDEAILSWKLQLKKDLGRISMPMRQVNFEGILLGFGWKKNGYDMGKNSWWGNSKMFRLCFMIESPCPGLYDCWKKSLSN